jgi:hypothetical protein
LNEHNAAGGGKAGNFTIKNESVEASFANSCCYNLAISYCKWILMLKLAMITTKVMKPDAAGKAA